MKVYIRGLRIWTYIIIVMQTAYSYSQSIDIDGMLAGWGTASYSEKLNGIAVIISRQEAISCHVNLSICQSV
jgi:hypothetical protein